MREALGYGCLTHLARARDPLITPHPLHLAMGHDHAERAIAECTLLAGIRTQVLQLFRRDARAQPLFPPSPLKLRSAWAPMGHAGAARMPTAMRVVSHSPYSMGKPHPVTQLTAHAT